MENSPPQGWYPDPARRGRERLWDGIRWTDQVRRIPGERGRPAWLAPVIAAGVVLVVIGSGLLAYGLSRGTASVAPSSTQSPSTQSSSTQSPSSKANGPVSSQPQPTSPATCAVGDPGYRASHPQDGRLHGGGLAMPMPEGWAVADPARVVYAFDVGLVTSPEGAGWAALGAVRIEDPYSTPDQASATISACLQQLSEAATLTINRSRATNVPGAHRAHEYSGVLQDGERTREFRVVVADVHSPESLAMYVRVDDPTSPHHAALTAAEDALAAA